MVSPDSSVEGEFNEPVVRRFEHHADHLAACQLDLLAQMEAQLRAAHRLMRHIEKLRGARDRVGPELSVPQRNDVLSSLGDDISGINGELQTQHQCLADMQAVIEKMRASLDGLQLSLRKRDSGAARDRE